MIATGTAAIVEGIVDAVAAVKGTIISAKVAIQHGLTTAKELINAKVLAETDKLLDSLNKVTFYSRKLT